MALRTTRLYLPSLISALVSCKRGYAGSADPAHAPNLDLGKDTIVPLPSLPPNMSNATAMLAEYGCLQDFEQGCHKIRDKRTCLGSRDGRHNTTDEKGIKIYGQPCTWCGGIPCTTGSMDMCAPLDLLVHGQGKEFLDFTARELYTVARCKNGRPVLPSRRPPELALADAGRHQSCGDEKVYTVPHIKDTFSTCTNFCYNKASVTWPYGRLGWNCIRAWFADGNTCHALRGASCDQKFDDWMTVALCQCQGKELEVPVPTMTTPRVIVTTTTPGGGCSWKSSCFPWWLLWLLLALCLLCICGNLLWGCCKKRKRHAEFEEHHVEQLEEEKWIRISEGTQTPATVTAKSEIIPTPAVAMVQPFETVVEVVPPSMVQTLQQTVVQPIQQTLFDMIDTNNDGVITRQELAAAGKSSAMQAGTQSCLVQQQMSVLPSEPIQNMPPSEPVMNLAPTEPIMNNRSSQALLQGTTQVVPTTQMLTETQVLQPMQPVQGQQMDLLTVTPWGYSVNHMSQ